VTFVAAIIAAIAVYRRQTLRRNASTFLEEYGD
jgi:hypothetical protein